MKILVIGDGSAGKRHASLLGRKGHSVTVTGPQGTALPPDYKAVVIASPPEWHTFHLDFMLRGQHILCEGPMTKEPKGSVGVRQMASNWRFVPHLQQLKHRLVHPVHAHLWYDHDLMRWRPDVDMTKTCYYWSGHDLINVHEVDIAFWFFGPPERIHVEKTHTGKSKACDGFVMLIKHQSGVMTTINSSWHASNYQRGLRIVERSGRVEELSWQSPADDHIVNLSYSQMLDHWLDHIERQDPLVAPNFTDGWRAYQALQGVCV